MTTLGIGKRFFEGYVKIQMFNVKFQYSATLKVIGYLPHGNCIDKSINSAQLICPIFILSKSKVKQYCSTNFGVTFPDQISGAYTHEKAYNFLPEMENLIRLVFCGHVLVWYLARVHLRLEFLVVQYPLEWLNKFWVKNMKHFLVFKLWKESSRPSHLYMDQVFVWKSEPIFCEGMLFDSGLWENKNTKNKLSKMKTQWWV